MAQLYILYENASGFAIFRTTEFEEVAVFLPQVKESVLNVSKFRSNVYFVTYQSFNGQKEALRNMQSINAGELSKDLQLFLENNIPRTKKSKQTVVLGVQDPDLASAISDKLGIKCISSILVKEIVRGIRFHYYKLVKGFIDEGSGSQSRLSLAHHYSRARLQFDATRQDSMIIESNSLMDELNKDIRTLGKRIKGSYASHFPELFRLIPNDSECYVQCVNAIGDRKSMPDDIEKALSDILRKSMLDVEKALCDIFSSKVETILDAAHNSMGSDISSVDLENIKMLCQRGISLIKRRQSTEAYLKGLMDRTAPNLSTLLGEMIGSKLICRAGGLEKLAKLPSSTLQVLGAEKNLFRSLKSKKKVPISGLLSSSSYVNKASKKKRGNVAKIVANKCSLAARIDCFSKVRKECGEQLMEDLKNCIKNIKY